MKNPLLFKFVVIAVVIVGAFLSAYPPEDRINLGLDLRGGAHILMQVDTEGAVGYQLQLSQSRLGNRFAESGLVYEAIGTSEASLEISGTDPSRSADVRQALEDIVGAWEISSLGGGNFRATIPLEAQTYFKTSAVDMTLATIRERIDALGVAEPLVQKQGLEGDRILVQLPGVEDPERIKDVIRDPSVLEWKEVSYPPGVNLAVWGPGISEEETAAMFGGTVPADTELYPQTRSDGLTVYWPLKSVSVVMGPDLRDAVRTVDEWGDPAVSFELTQDAGKRFETATTRNVGKRMAILLGNSQTKNVISAPTIQSKIRDVGIIQGGFSLTEAEDLALKLRSGAIATDMEIIEERTVGPSLGRDSIQAGLAAGLTGFVGVLLFMLVYYRLAGVNAVVALGLNVLLCLRGPGCVALPVRGYDEHAGDLDPARNRGADPDGRHGGRRQRADLRAHPRGAAVGQDGAQRRRPGIRQGAEDDPGLQRHDRGGSDLPRDVRHGSGPRLRRHAGDRACRFDVHRDLRVATALRAGAFAVAARRVAEYLRTRPPCSSC